MKTIKYLALAALALLTLSCSGAQQTTPEQNAPLAETQQNDPIIGTWKLNVAESKYDPGPPPRSRLHKYEADGKDRLKRTILEEIAANGEPVAPGAPSINIYDGKEYPFTPGGAAGGSGADAVVNRRFDAHTSERITTKDGMLVGLVQRMVSPDGKTLTIKVFSIDNEQGNPTRYIEVYDKQ